MRGRGVQARAAWFGAAAFALGGGVAVGGADAQPETLSVTVLGSGTPIPSRTQAGAAILIEAGAQAVLVDCGRGCTTRLAAADPQLLARIDTVFLTHLHSDHVTGLADLLLNGWTQGRDVPLTVFGPDGTGTMMAGLTDAYAADIGYREAAGVPATTRGLTPDVRVLPSAPEETADPTWKRGGLAVTAFPVSHGRVPAYGYRIEYAGRVAVLSGDTTDTPALRAQADGADLVLLEVLSPPMMAAIQANFSDEQAAQIAGLHLTPAQGASILAASDAKMGVYYHTVSTCAGDAALIAGAKQAFSGDVLVASDLMRIELGPDAITVSRASGDRGACRNDQDIAPEAQPPDRRSR